MTTAIQEPTPRARTTRLGDAIFSRTALGAALLVVLLLFGGTQLPKLARSLGQAQKEFKKGVSDPNSDDDDNSKA